MTNNDGWTVRMAGLLMQKEKFLNEPLFKNTVLTDRKTFFGNALESNYNMM